MTTATAKTKLPAERWNELYEEGRACFELGQRNDGNGLSGEERLAWQEGWEDAAIEDAGE